MSDRTRIYIWADDASAQRFRVIAVENRLTFGELFSKMIAGYDAREHSYQNGQTEDPDAHGARERHGN